MIDGFVFYRTFRDEVSGLEPADRLACYEAVMNYALDGIETESGIEHHFLQLAKPLIEGGLAMMIERSEDLDSGYLS